MYVGWFGFGQPRGTLDCNRRIKEAWCIMDKIKSTAQAAAVVRAIKDALNQLIVQGRDNCYIVVACDSDLNALAAYLHDEIDKENIVNGKENEA